MSCIFVGLTALVDCKLIHYNYYVGTRGLCESGLFGLVLMLIASFLAACLLTIMVIFLEISQFFLVHD